MMTQLADPASLTTVSLPPLDSDGHLIDHLSWSPAHAAQLAQTLGLKLDALHFQILSEVRAYYERFGHAPTTRPLIKYLQQSMPEAQLDNARLQQLFNTGLIARHINRLAGLPKPANCL